MLIFNLQQTPPTREEIVIEKTRLKTSLMQYLVKKKLFSLLIALLSAMTLCEYWIIDIIDRNQFLLVVLVTVISVSIMGGIVSYFRGFAAGIQCSVIVMIICNMSFIVAAAVNYVVGGNGGEIGGAFLGTITSFIVLFGFTKALSE